MTCSYNVYIIVYVHSNCETVHVKVCQCYSDYTIPSSAGLEVLELHGCTSGRRGSRVGQYTASRSLHCSRASSSLTLDDELQGAG